jgi:hypothetical protein
MTVAAVRPVDAVPVISGYAELVQALIARRHALALSQLELEERAGFSSGFVSHLESWDHPCGRRAGDLTLEYWMGALGIALQLVEVDRPGRGPVAKPTPCQRDRQDVGQRALPPEPVHLRPKLRNERHGLARRPLRVPA